MLIQNSDSHLSSCLLKGARQCVQMCNGKINIHTTEHTQNLVVLFETALEEGGSGHQKVLRASLDQVIAGDITRQ